MPGEVDKLQVRIDASAGKAFKAIEQLISRLSEFNRMSGKSVGALINLNDRLKELQMNTNKIRNIRNPLRNFNDGAKQTKESVADTVKPTRELSDNMKRLDKFGSAAGNALKKIAHGGFTVLGKVVHGTVGRLQKFLHSIMRIAGYRAIRSALRFITQGFSQGIENLYLWSQAWNTTFAPTMDRFATSMLYLKNGFAAMFSPLIEYFMPYIELLVDKLVDAFNWVQRLFAELTGRNTWNKAVKVQTQYKESTDSTAKSVKALREQIQLMDFDELNNLTDNQDNGSGGAGDVLNPNPAEMFTLEKTAVEGMKGTFWENVKTKLTGWLEDQGLWDENGFNWHGLGEIIGKKLGEAWEIVKQWWDNIGGWQGVIDGIADAIEAAVEFIDGIIDGLFPGRKASRNEFEEQSKFNEEVTNAVKEANIKSDERQKVKVGTVPDEDYWQNQIWAITGDLNTLTGLQAQNQDRLAKLEEKKAAGGEWNEYDTRNLTAAQFTETYLSQAISGLQEELDRADVYMRLGAEGEAYTGTFMEKVADAAAKAVSNGRIDDDINNLLDTVFDTKNIVNTLNGLDAKVNTWIDKILRPSSYGLTGNHGNGGRFAAGGYPTQGTMFYAGEAGAEFVGNINGRTGVASGAEITGIGDAVWSTGNTTANLLAEILAAVREKDLTIAPSASLGKVVTRSQKLYATQTG